MEDETDNANYSPVSVLPSISNIFEKIIYVQIEKFMNNELSSLLCGFIKKHNTRHALFLTSFKTDKKIWIVEI